MVNFYQNILISVGKAELFNQSNINNPELVKMQIIQTLNDLDTQE